MPQIPVADRQVQMKSQDAVVMKEATLGSGIVANNVAEASQGLYGSIGKAAGMAAEYNNKQDAIMSENAVNSAYAKAHAEMNNLTTDTGLGEHDIPKGLLNRKLGMVANDSVQELDRGIASISEKSLEGLTEYQKQQVQTKIATHAITLRDSVAKHQVKERGDYADNIYKSALDAHLDSAASASNNDVLDQVINEMHATTESTLKAKGTDAGTISIEKQKHTDKAIETSVFSKLESDPKKAKETLEYFREDMSAEAYQKQAKAIDGKVFENKRSGIYSDVLSRMKLSDGEPDFARIEKTIRSSSAFNEKEKEDLNTYAKSRAMEDMQNFHRSEKDTLNRFENDIIGNKKKGMTLDDALKTAGKYGRDEKDIKDKEDIARKLYTDPSMKSDPDTYLKLYENNQKGNSSKSEIKQAFADNKISASDYIGLNKGFLTSKLGEGKKEDALAHERIKILAKEKFGNDQTKSNEFMYAVNTLGQGKSAEEKIAIANAQLKDVVVSPGWLFDSKDAAYKITNKQTDAASAANASFREAIGHEEMNAIGKGVMRNPGATSWGISDVDNFAKEFGGIDGIKKGTPAGNAITSLKNLNKPVTAQNIKDILKVHNDGNWDGR
jgi:hypothetical protein